MGRPAKYPWERWFQHARAATGLHVPVDGLDVDLRTFQIQAGNAARSRHYQLRTETCRSHPDCLRMWCRVQPRRNWDQYLNGEENIIMYEEMGCTPDSFRRMLRAAAKKKGKRVIINDKPLNGGMVFQSFPDDNATKKCPACGRPE